MNALQTLMETPTWGNTPTEWLIATVVALAAAALALTAKGMIHRRLSRRAPETKGLWDDWLVATLPGTRALLVLVLAAWAGGQLLTLSPAITRGLDRAAIIALLIQGGIWLNRSLVFWLKHRFDGDAADGARSMTGPLLGFILRAAMWAIILLLLLDNLGFNVTTLVASLGVGGVAVALAVQNILGDLFASLSIALDKPFVIGDFVVVDEHSGNVEHVGLKTTRIRSLSGEQIIFSNADLLKSRIRNYKRMQERRIAFAFGITYETPLDQVEALPRLVRDIIDAQPEVRFDRAHFKSFGASSLDFEVVYYVLDNDYRKYMDIQQAINLAIARCLQARHIDFAYPTQTLHLVGAMPASGCVQPPASGDQTVPEARKPAIASAP